MRTTRDFLEFGEYGSQNLQIMGDHNDKPPSLWPDNQLADSVIQMILEEKSCIWHWMW